MSRVIDQRTVELKFNNQDFEKNAAKTSETLAKLDKSLKMDGAAKGINEAQRAVDSFNLNSMARSLETISSRFTTLGAIGFSVLNTLTNQVMSFGATMVNKALSPIIEGGKRRAQNIEQAKFQFEGLKMDVTSAMNSANEAVLGTAFGLDEAAKVAAQFGASGMQAGEKMTAALRGISGVAALAGSSYEDIGRVFTKVAGQGRLMGDDLNSLASRGVNAAATLAKALNTTEAEVRSMVSKGKIDFQTFADAMNDAFGEHATKASLTYSGAASNMRAAFARIGQNYFLGTDMMAPDGYYERQRKVFNALKVVIDGVNAAIKPLFKIWNEFSNIRNDALISFIEKLGANMDIFKRASEPLGKIMTSLLTSVHDLAKLAGKAWLDIFPLPLVETWKTVTNSITGLKELVPESSFTPIEQAIYVLGKLANVFKLTKESSEKLSRVFKGFFAIFGIIFEIGKSVIGIFARLASTLFKSSGSWLDIAANAGDFLVKLHEMVKEGTLFNNIFEKIGNVLTWIIEKLQKLASMGLGKLRELPDTWAEFKEMVSPYIATVIEKIAWSYNKLKDAISNTLDSFNLGNTAAILSTGALALILVKAITSIKDFFSKVKSFELFTDVLGNIKESIDTILVPLKDYLAAMQSELNSKALMNIAVAVALLAGSIVLLSMIKPEKLAAALGAIATLTGILLAAMKTLTLISIDKKGTTSLAIFAGAMIAISAAILILSAAVSVLARLSWEELTKGLLALWVVMGGVLGLAKGLDGYSGSLIRVGMGMIPLAVGILILAIAVRKFGEIDSNATIKGLASIALALSGITLALRLMPKDTLLKGLALLPIAFALNILASAVEKLGSLDGNVITTGLIAIAAVLSYIALAMELMPTNMLGISLGLLVVSAALLVVQNALERFGNMNGENIAAGLVAMGGALIIIAGSLHAMKGALLGAIVLGIAVASLMPLASVMVLLGNLGWEGVIIGLTALAGALGIFALFGLIPAPVLAGMAIFAAISAVMAGSIFLAAMGIAAMAGALAALAVSGALTANTVAMLIDLLPLFGAKMGEALVNAAVVIGMQAPVLVDAFVRLLNSIFQAIRIVLPAMGELGLDLLFMLLNGIRNNIKELFDLGADIIVKLLEGLEENTHRLAEASTDLIVTFINEWGKQADAIMEAGSSVIVLLIEAFTRQRDRIMAAGTDSIIAFLDGIQRDMTRVGAKATEVIITFINELSKNSELIRKAGLKAVVDFIDGIGDNIDEVCRAAYRVAEKLKDCLNRWIDYFLPGMSRKGSDVGYLVAGAVGSGLSNSSAPAAGVNNAGNQVVNTMNAWSGALNWWGWSWGVGVLQGLYNGLANGGWWNSIRWLMSSLGNTVKNALARAVGFASPAKKIAPIGIGIIQGLMVGMTDYIPNLEKTSKYVGDQLTYSLADAISDISNVLPDMLDLSPTIVPVLDLSSMEKDAQYIGSLMTDQAEQFKFDISDLYQKADNIRNDISDNGVRSKGDIIVTNNYELNQTNNSPKALSASEIYRDSKSLISLAEKVGDKK